MYLSLAFKMKKFQHKNLVYSSTFWKHVFSKSNSLLLVFNIFGSNTSQVQELRQFLFTKGLYLILLKKRKILSILCPYSIFGDLLQGPICLIVPDSQSPYSIYPKERKIHSIVHELDTRFPFLFFLFGKIGQYVLRKRELVLYEYKKFTYLGFICIQGYYLFLNILFRAIYILINPIIIINNFILFQRSIF